MGKRNGSGSDKQKSRKHTGQDQRGEFLLVDVARVRFQHSRIRPTFSGCGRSVEGTLESIRRGEISPHDLPPIQVLALHEPDESAGGHDPTEPGSWYFSLNNRRLWVLKRCREEGLLLPSNLVRVRSRRPKSASEITRYTVQNCALEATLMRESAPSANENAVTTLSRQVNPRAARPLSADNVVSNESLAGEGERSMEPCNDDESSLSSDDGSRADRFTNRFSAIID